MSGTRLDVGTTFVRWIWCRAVLHGAWCLICVYLVVDAHLPASELVMFGAVGDRRLTCLASNPIGLASMPPFVSVGALGGRCWMVGTSASLATHGSAEAER